MPRTPQRPGTVLSAAIILIIVGTWSLLAGVCGAGSIAVLAAIPEPKEKAMPGQPPDAMAPMRFVAKEVPGYYVFAGVSLGLDTLLGLGQLFCGLGLLRMSSRARTVAILLTLAKLFLSFGGQAFNFIFVFPAQARFYELNPAPPGMPDMASFSQTLGIGAVVFGMVIQLAIVGAILLLLLLPGTRQAFVDAALPQPEEEPKRRSGYEDEEDDGYGSSSAKPKSPPETGFSDRS